MSEEKPVELNAEEKADLAEAVAAEIEFRAVDSKFEKCIQVVQVLHKSIVELLGRESQGSPAYSRNKAIEKLEECMHRIHDGVAAIKMRQPAELEALKNAQANGTVLKMPGVK